MLSSRSRLFAQTGAKELNEVDFHYAVQHSIAHFSQSLSVEAQQRWRLFTIHLGQLIQLERSEKFMVFKVAYSSFDETTESSDLAQFLTVAIQLKEHVGMHLFHSLFSAQVGELDNKLGLYTQICQLIIHLQDKKGLYKKILPILPDLVALADMLRNEHTAYLLELYPERDIDFVLARFSQQDDLVHFPLSTEELATIKEEYLAVKRHQKICTQKTMLELSELGTLYGQNLAVHKQDLIGLIAETVRRIYKMSPYDTQLISFIALTRSPEHLKGRIAQIKTGEGKSMLIAMLAAFMGCQGLFVDVVTSAKYLAIRDERHFAAFFKALGLSSSHICHAQSEAEHFQSHILYGTNTDFEFAMMRDGLGKKKLRYSWRNGVLIPRGFEGCIVDEVDNLVLDAALNSAIISVPGTVDYSWAYHDILAFVKEHADKNWSANEMAQQLIAWFHNNKDAACLEKLDKIDVKKIKTWLESAASALFEKKLGRDYLVKTRGDLETSDKLEVVIVDYHNTGRSSYGSQWRNGLHQMLQALNGVEITKESSSAASMSHPTYFNLYRCLLGLTGTVGEAIEREEIKGIYNVGSFDVPPHFPSLRTTLPPKITKSQEEHFERIFENVLAMKEAGRPVLVLLETITDTEAFCRFLKQRGHESILINENQRESEDYLIGLAGESGRITVATNTAGRGTDILLSPESKAAGGLHVIFGFYASNLRVLGQGFGRAGRQGQPGSCCMILNINDESIQEFIKSCSEMRHIMAGNANLEFEGGAEEFVAILDALRSQKIQKQSTQRALCAQKEALYFNKLQLFFKELEMVHQRLEDDVFTNTLLEQCASYVPEEPREDVAKLPLIDNSILQNMSASLLAQQMSGNTVDWKGLVTYFKTAFVTEFKNKWAHFYVQLHDDEGGMTIEAEHLRVEALYHTFQQSVDGYLTHREQYLVQLLHALLDNAYGSIVNGTKLQNKI